MSDSSARYTQVWLLPKKAIKVTPEQPEPSELQLAAAQLEAARHDVIHRRRRQIIQRYGAVHIVTASAIVVDDYDAVHGVVLERGGPLSQYLESRVAATRAAGKKTRGLIWVEAATIVVHILRGVQTMLIELGLLPASLDPSHVVMMPGTAAPVGGGKWSRSQVACVAGLSSATEVCQPVVRAWAEDPRGAEDARLEYLAPERWVGGCSSVVDCLTPLTQESVVFSAGALLVTFRVHVRVQIVHVPEAETSTAWSFSRRSVTTPLTQPAC
jgi:hypothetical protein